MATISRPPVFLVYPFSNLSLTLPLLHHQTRNILPGRAPRIRAVREWREYEDAVRDKDLARALRLLKSTESSPPFRTSPSSSSPASSLETDSTSPFTSLSYAASSLERAVAERERARDWEVLDTCISADDMRLVGNAYSFLQDRGLLPNFGKCRNIVLEGTRDVTPKVLKESTGLEASQLAPKKWGTSGGSRLALIGLLGGITFLLNNEIEIRPNIAAILALAGFDAVFLGGSCLAQILSFWPPYKRRILVHEAGHLVTAYLMGCPVRGVILDPIVALQMGIKGQAGTQFWDEKLENELAEGRLSSTAFDRYCMILFAGIAAEALVYGEAEGGENDENLFRSICVLLQPPFSIAQMSNQARWSVLQSYNLLKWHKQAHRAALKALERGYSLSTVIKRIEAAIISSE